MHYVCVSCVLCCTGKLPVLGICYGVQEIVNHFGGLVERAPKREFGFAELNVLTTEAGVNQLVAGIPTTSRVRVVSS